MPAPLQEMVRALDEEIAVLRARGGGGSLALQGGERLEAVDGVGPGGHVLYRFPLPQASALRDDTPVRVQVAHRPLAGFVVSAGTTEVVLALAEDLGPRLPQASLAADASSLVQALRDRLVAVGDGKHRPFHPTSAALTLGLGIRSGVTEPVGPLDDLNPEQQGAVRRALGSNATFVWGPPGTGKTATLGRIIHESLARDRSLLVVSNTNAAVDQLARRLLPVLTFTDGDVLRVGPTTDVEVRARIGLEAVLGRQGHALEQQRAQLQQRQERLVAETEALEAALAEHAAQASATTEYHRAARMLAQAQERRSRAESAGQPSAERLRIARERLRGAQGMSGVARFLTGARMGNLTAALAAAERQAAADREQWRQAEARVLGAQREVDRLGTILAGLEAAGQRRPTLASCQAHLPGLQREREEGAQQLAEVTAALGGLREKLLAGCRVLLCTADRLYLPGQIPARDFDTVVIDEASMVTLPLTYYAAGLAARAVVIAGDFRQLPAIVASNSDLAALWLRPSAFEKAGLPAQVRAGTVPPHLAALRTQYRMTPAVGTLVGDLFYGGALRSAPALLVRAAPPLLQATDGPALGYVDTAALKPWASYGSGGGSRFNLVHAMVVQHLVTRWPHGVGAPSIGVVVPYAAQSRLVQITLSPTRPDVTVATAHRFQGDERDVIILDLTDSPGAPLGRFLEATEPDQEGARLLNVAISRARHCLIVVANFDYMLSRAPRSVAARLLQAMRLQGTALEAVTPLTAARPSALVNAVAPARPGGPGDPTAGAHPESPLCFTEQTFLPAFTQDLEHAQEQVTILAPFVTAAGSSRLAEVLRAAVARSVRVKVVTRPPGRGQVQGQDAAGLLEALRGLGVSVETRPAMHEKVAFVDRAVTWQGSLNILSYGASTEVMFRLVHPEFHRRLTALLLPPPRSTSPERRASAMPTPGARATQMTPAGVCPRCSGRLVTRQGPSSTFLGCSRYPACTFTRAMPREG